MACGDEELSENAILHIYRKALILASELIRPRKPKLNSPHITHNQAQMRPGFVSCSRGC